MILRILDDATAEFADAIAHYEDIEAGLGVLRFAPVAVRFLFLFKIQHSKSKIPLPSASILFICGSIPLPIRIDAHKATIHPSKFLWARRPRSLKLRDLPASAFRFIHYP